MQQEDRSIKKKATIPFGSLPWLRLGQYIVDGKPLRESDGYIKNIQMLNVDEGNIKPAVQCIPKIYTYCSTQRITMKIVGVLLIGISW